MGSKATRFARGVTIATEVWVGISFLLLAGWLGAQFYLQSLSTDAFVATPTKTWMQPRHYETAIMTMSPARWAEEQALGTICVQNYLAPLHRAFRIVTLLVAIVVLIAMQVALARCMRSADRRRVEAALWGVWCIALAIQVYFHYTGWRAVVDFWYGLEWPVRTDYHDLTTDILPEMGTICLMNVLVATSSALISFGTINRLRWRSLLRPAIGCYVLVVLYIAALVDLNAMAHSSQTRALRAALPPRVFVRAKSIVARASDISYTEYAMDTFAIALVLLATIALNRIAESSEPTAFELACIADAPSEADRPEPQAPPDTDTIKDPAT